jgi:predicted DNA-binding protein (MmcQ/YjbR family)
MAWVSILNPSNNSFEMLEKLIKESYQVACDKYLARVKT